MPRGGTRVDETGARRVCIYSPRSCPIPSRAPRPGLTPSRLRPTMTPAPRPIARLLRGNSAQVRAGSAAGSGTGPGPQTMSSERRTGAGPMKIWGSPITGALPSWVELGPVGSSWVGDPTRASPLALESNDADGSRSCSFKMLVSVPEAALPAPSGPPPWGQLSHGQRQQLTRLVGRFFVRRQGMDDRREASHGSH
jgi:hypothetical protein